VEGVVVVVDVLVVLSVVVGGGGVVCVVVVGVVVEVDHVEVVLLVVPGAAVVTTDVGSEVATAVPFLLFAVSTTRSVEPTSASATRYVCADADAMGEQELPLLKHRTHWYP
jgi:hypothetical protein